MASSSTCAVPNRQSAVAPPLLLVARDELELIAGPSCNGNGTNGFSASSASPHSSAHSNGGTTNTFSSSSLSGGGGQNGVVGGGQCPQFVNQLGDGAGGGPLSTLRRSLRQMNPFKSRLFRLPATPRLSRSKKVLGRGEHMTGWNFARPSNGGTAAGGELSTAQSSATNSLRPLSSASFGPADFEYCPGGRENGGGFGATALAPFQHYQHRRFSQQQQQQQMVVGDQFQPSPMLQRRALAAAAPSVDACSCCGQIGGGGGEREEGEELEAMDDLDQFLSAMESISKRGGHHHQIVGGSCRVGHQREEAAIRWAGGTVAVPPPAMSAFTTTGLPEPGTKRTRPPIPSFNPPSWSHSPQNGPTGLGRMNGFGQQRHECCPAPAGGQPREEWAAFLPSTCYSPNGEMYAARWRPAGGQLCPSSTMANSQYGQIGGNSQIGKNVGNGQINGNGQIGGNGINAQNGQIAKNDQIGGGSPRLGPAQRQQQQQRPQPLYLTGINGRPTAPKGAAVYEEPKSPSQSTITLLNTMAAQQQAMRSASTASGGAIRQKQPRPQQLARSSAVAASAAALFPQTQLQRRRSACSASAALEMTAGDPRRKSSSRDRSIAEEEEGEGEGEEAEAGANYYGRDVLRLMGGAEGGGGTKEQNSPSTPLLSPPPPLFPLADELFAPPSSGVDGEAACQFVGREWLFKEMCQQLITERAQLVLLLGPMGTGKSAIVRQLVANSPFCAAQKNGSSQPQSSSVADQQQQQHNTVDSGIAVSAGSGGGNSSGSQLSLLNVSGHIVPPPEPTSSLCCPPSPTPSLGGGRNYEWLRELGRHVCAFHFAHLHSAKSCAIAEFVRSICAQLCQCPQLKHSYGKMIRSNPALHLLATDECASLGMAPMALFAQLVLQPIGQLYGGEERKRREERRARRCASKASISDYGGSNLGIPDDRHQSFGATSSSSSLPEAILIVVDALDEAGFHRTDGGESIGWLLRLALPQCPAQLRFVATLAPGPGALAEQNAIFGTLAEGERPMEARSIRLDDWELDERVARDARVLVEAKVHQSAALEKWVSGQFRRQSFFCPSSPTSPASSGLDFQLAHQANLAEFSAQLVHRCRANAVALQLALGMLAEGRLLSLGTLPATLGQLYALHFRHKFQPVQFGPLSTILSVLLASLHPLDFDALSAVLNATENEGEGDGHGAAAEELRHRLALLSPLVLQLPASGHLVLAHPSLRDWLLKEAGSTEFAIDIRHGHILLAFALLVSARHCPLGHDQLFELAHHLLKANPHKYMRPDFAAIAQLGGMPQGRDAQIQWLRMGGGVGGGGLDGLLWPRNVFYPNAKASRLLLLAGADPNANKWPNGIDQPLLCAFARAGNGEMVQLLLQFGANPNAGSPPPLILAIQHGHEPVVRLLCANGADLCAKDAEGRGPLWHAAASDSLAILGFLLDIIGEADGKQSKKLSEMAIKGAALNGNGGDIVVHHRYSSVCSGDYADVEEERRPIKNGSNRMAGCRPDRNDAIREAFECAAERGSVRVCRFLLDCTDAVLDTSRAMCIACANGRSELVQFLLSRGATLAPEQTWNGKSALVCSVESGSWDLVVSVLNGVGPNALAEVNAMGGPDRLSPLMVAARHGHVGLVDLLVNRGAHLDAADAHGRTAAMHAIEAGQTSTVGLLLERGCSLHARDGHGNSMLHLLARHPSKCLIGRLLDAGLSLEDKNREDLRPIEVAIQCGQLLAVDTFLRRGARLRSLTWQIALSSHPPLLLVLLRKLLDDAQILLRRKRVAEAQHRFSYALQKCDEMLAKANDDDQRQQQRGGGGGPGQVAASSEALRAIRPQLRRYKVQALHSMAGLKRRANNIPEAISLANDALAMLNWREGGMPPPPPTTIGCHSTSPSASSDETEEEEEEGDAQRRDQRFELHLLRAKCHFDARDLAKARMDAQSAACLRPGDQEAQSLLAILSMG